MLMSAGMPAVELSGTVQPQIQCSGDVGDGYLPVDEAHVRNPRGLGHARRHLANTWRIGCFRAIATSSKPLVDPTNVDSSATTYWN